LTFARVGSPDSVLQLDQVLGVPDALLEQMRDGDGGSWPARWLEEPPTVHHRGGATFPRWQDCEVGTVVRNVVTCPLRYLGIAAGVALFFNVEADDQGLPLKLSTLRGLGELGAALLHRMQLESEALFARHLETQLEIAATIQARLLPAAPPGNRRWQCAWSSRPSQSIGGDYLDLFDGPHDTILAMIADVSGHGIDSALLAASTRAHYRALAPHTRPGPALAQLNRELYREVGATGMFVTAVAVQLAADGRQARLASAGHNPVLLLRTERRELIEVGASGPPLGFAADTAYDDAVVTLAAGDVIVLYSDGITEATDGTGEMFGEERLGDALRACAGDAAHAILTEILAAVDRFTGRSGNLSDDASIAVVKVAG
jgi:sigma-B regulation protein RsbU (phosphoserine phosphatase)